MTVPSRQKVFRKNLLIFPKFQITLLAINLGIIVTIALFIWVGFENAMGDLKPAAGLSSLEAQTFRRFLEYQTNNLRAWLFTTLSVGVLASAVLTLVLSHRLAGPLVRMRSYFRQISEGGRQRPLEFRDGDYLSDLPPLINGALERVRSDRAGDRDAA